MNISGQLEVVDDCACYRPTGTLTLEEAVELVNQAIAYARDHQIPKLLFNAKDVTGLRSPSLPERYFYARQWAATSRSLVQLALVIPAEMIDPEKFGVTVAHNAGLNADVFSNESEAWAWLQGQPAKGVKPEPFP